MLIDERLKQKTLRGVGSLSSCHGAFAAVSPFPHEHELVINMFHIHNAIGMHI